jgi:glucokinase
VPKTHYVIGVDLGGQSVKLGVVDTHGAILIRRQVPIDAAQFEEVLSRLIVQQIDALFTEAAALGKEIAGVGMVMPGYMNAARGKLLFAANLPTLSGSDFLDHIRDQVPAKIVFDADCNGAALGEFRYGAGRDIERLVVATVGTGIGGAVVIGGHLLRVVHHISGSLGHIIVDAGGRRCACGARGCLETRASGRALEAMAAKLLKKDERVSGEEINHAAVNGEAWAMRAVRECGWWLGAGIASWCATYAPQQVVIGGGIAALGRSYLEAVRDGLHEVGQPHLTANVEIVPALLGANAGMVGAASMMLHGKE